MPTHATAGIADHVACPRPRVQVTNPATGKSVVCQIRDVGPWNLDDPYWQTGNRPQAETGVDMRGRTTNLAGIDLTPAAARAIGINGKGKVDWEFDGTSHDVPRWKSHSHLSYSRLSYSRLSYSRLSYSLRQCRAPMPCLPTSKNGSCDWRG